MAQHGGLAQQQQPQGAVPPPRPPVPRVHRPRLAIMTPPPPTTIILQPLGTATTTPTPASSRRRQQQAAPPVPSAEVTLAAPRPDGERTVNEYVETPFRPGAASEGAPVRKSESTRRDPPHHQALHLPIGGGGTHGGAPTPVTKQPVTFKKDAAPRPGAGGGDTTPASGAGTSGTASGDCFRGSIICPECGRCRCESCRQPRPLPSRWLCNNACFCSAETSLDYASCLCCVKGLFYHCSKDYEDGATGSCADDPCSCGPHRLLARWGCLAALSLALPCLWCYWPLRGCVGLCEKCYARYSSQGCRCEPRRAPKLSDVTPEKRLLDSSPDF